MLESVYEIVLAHELAKRGLKVERQVSIPIEYNGLKFQEGFRADMRLGLLINFGSALLKNGISRVVNGL